jgi:ABC-type multidrug transport system fused ATPase/permease subunit
LARLLVRAADPVSGSIELEGHCLSEYTLASVRRTVCYVPQHPILFQATIRTNLLYANPFATTREVQNAIEMMQLTPVLNRLSRGLDTLGPQGAILSGGERQRLALARSLLRNSVVLVLDESTSALNAPTERAALSALTRFQPHQTIVVISHRISSLTWVDRFVLLDHGKIAGTGSHAELYSHSGLYRSLYDSSGEDRARPIYPEFIATGQT